MINTLMNDPHGKPASKQAGNLKSCKRLRVSHEHVFPSSITGTFPRPPPGNRIKGRHAYSPVLDVRSLSKAASRAEVLLVLPKPSERPPHRLVSLKHYKNRGYRVGRRGNIIFFPFFDPRVSPILLLFIQQTRSALFRPSLKYCRCSTS